ncbi:hypothetical protein Taro_045474 [Colocasia esculenta]|uniref:Uncharacterized protein n=1 Tax=Colocasia esculenta TaxID=4460 RepID=A0A843X4V8_COLES|nr:hypothetical protein [Colocasia esculenta]
MNTPEDYPQKVTTQQVKGPTTRPPRSTTPPQHLKWLVLNIPRQNGYPRRVQVPTTTRYRHKITTTIVSQQGAHHNESEPQLVGLRRLPFQASLATPVSMAPRRRPREGVAEQATPQEVGDAPPPQQTQPLPQDAHSGIAPPPPPPQVVQGLDMTRFLEGMAQFVAQHRDAPFVRGLRPELRQALIVARVTDLDAAYQTAAALEADTLRTRARSAEVQTQVVPSQPRQQQGNVQTTPRTVTSYVSTSTGTTANSRPSHSPECSSSSSSSRHLCSSVSKPEVLGHTTTSRNHNW